MLSFPSILRGFVTIFCNEVTKSLNSRRPYAIYSQARNYENSCHLEALAEGSRSLC